MTQVHPTKPLLQRRSDEYIPSFLMKLKSEPEMLGGCDVLKGRHAYGLVEKYRYQVPQGSAKVDPNKEPELAFVWCK